MIEASIKYKNQDNSYTLIQLIMLYTYKHLIAIRIINTVECTDAFSQINKLLCGICNYNNNINKIMRLVKVTCMCGKDG